MWRAVTEPERLSRWYPFAVVALDLRVGGAMRFDDGEGTVLDGVVVELDPPRRFAFSEHAPEEMRRENDDLVRFELEPDGDGCLLVFTHVFDDRPGAASYAVGWDLCLRMLGVAVDGEEPDWPTPPQGALEERIDALGLGAGRVEDGPSGPVLTVERQLSRPAEEVWAEIVGDTAGDRVPDGLLVPGVAASGRIEAKPPEVFEYAWSADGTDGADGSAAGRVRWELSAGTGHGARLVVTQTGRAGDRDLLEAALPAWERRIREVGRRVAGLEA